MDKKKHHCTVCKKRIREEELKALGKYFHKEHFQCGLCRKVLSTKSYYEKDGIPYCKADYKKVKLPKCAHCNEPVEDGVKALGKHFHKEHFKCGYCHQVLRKKAYCEKDGIPYCKEDYKKLILPKCAHCNDGVVDGVSAAGKYFHKEHFLCGYCHKNVFKKVFFEKDGVPYCEEDFKNHIAPTCSYCQTVITDTANGVRALGKIFHKEHFLCCYCHKELYQQVFYEKDGIPYCEEDYNTHISPTCSYCNGIITDVANGVRAIGKSFHKEHFLCGYCHKGLYEQVFFEKDGIPYCETDYYNYISPVCAHCNFTIADIKDAIRALGKTFHKEHFLCGFCHKALGKQIFFVKDGIAYCEEDYNNHISPMCAQCHGAIIDGVNVLGKNYHKEHFQCDYCHKPLYQKVFYENNGIPYCEYDYYTYISPTCASCNDYITDTANCVTVLGQNFHKEHFQCGLCYQLLYQQVFYEKDGVHYCEEDYNNYISPTCAHCNCTITDIENGVTALGKNFHKEHFQCSYCHQELYQKVFYEKDGIPYCEEDYNNYVAPTCWFCKDIITDFTDMVRALGKNFHKKHFQCGYCHKVLGPKFFREKNGVPYCEADYNNYISPICAQCNGAIKDLKTIVRALGKNFHKEHFQCGYCYKELSVRAFREKGGVPYCQADYYNFIAPKCAQCICDIKDLTKTVRAVGKIFHKEHFQCGYCHKELNPKLFHEKNGVPYCKEDYNEHISPKCAHCNGVILDLNKIVRALGKKFHKEHFICGYCHKVLDPRSFREKDGFPYCEEDYYNYISPKCAHCNGAIMELNKMVRALGTNFHEEHFQCGFCHKRLSLKAFREKDGIPYCETDYNNHISPTCAHCNGAILDLSKIVRALGKNFHKEHFQCGYCQKVLTPTTFWEKDGIPYCEDDFNNCISPKCAHCNGYITDLSKIVRAMGKNYHKEHFQCGYCQKELGPTEFYEKHGVPFCEEDYNNHISPKCANCNEPIMDLSKIVVALGKNFHKEHFQCGHCHKELGPTGFYEKHGVPFCEADFNNHISPKCANCNCAIMDLSKIVRALGKNFHKEHFQCGYCQKELSPTDFYEKHGVPFCEADFNNHISPKCAHCNNAIVDMSKIVRVLGKNFHREHFQCGYCFKELDIKAFHEKDGVPYCETDFNNHISPKCAHCNGAITDLSKIVRALGKNFHKEHFQCGYCHKELGPKAFHEKDGVPYCEADFSNHISPTCANCNTSIIDMSKSVRAFGKNFHKKHFQCGYCHKVLDQQIFHEKDGVPYCELDFYDHISPKCGHCNASIMDLTKSVKALEKYFHKEHFQCGYCHQELDKTNFCEKDGIPYCEKDYNDHILPKCAFCKEPIVDGVTALGASFHKEHFKCGLCQEELLSQNFYEKNGVPYCKTDYQNFFLPKCARCNSPIVKDCFTALGKPWHKEHFICTKCKKTLEKDNFHEKDGKAYCSEDYKKMFPLSCAGCNKPITGQYVSISHNKFHPNCLKTQSQTSFKTKIYKESIKCCICKQELNNQKHHERDGAFYCETDYQNHLNPKCAHCNGAITENCLTAMGKMWHPEHFICAKCNKPLPANNFHEHEDKPYCKDDFNKMFPMKCAGCKQTVTADFILGRDGIYHPNCFVCKY